MIILGFGSGIYLATAAVILGAGAVVMIGEEMEQWAKKQMKKLEKREVKNETG